MNKVRTSFGGVVLTGVLTLGTAASAIAATPADSVAKTGPSVGVQQASAMNSSQDVAGVGAAYRLKKLESLTSPGAKSTEAWWDYLALYREGANYFGFNWKTDGCTKSPDKLPGGYNFYWACYRHDFGYRNYKKFAGDRVFRAYHKKRIDKVFLQDMRQTCQYKPWGDPTPPVLRKKLKAMCLNTAQKYYSAVVVMG
ncbi:phospholipase A2 [Streptomyces sp. NPDC001339]|uniref:phospholipase A2 n=1 Tax=Streptomyces sp. NPDC001339 TaxID=3364563 RepID=UPI0036CEB4F2